MTVSKLEEPLFYHRDYANDIKSESTDNEYLKFAKRITLVALPFLSLYKPLSFALSLTLGGLRTAASLQNLQWGSLVQTALAVISLGGTLFAHPLGMLLTTVHDAAIDSFYMLQHIYRGELTCAIGKYGCLMNNGLYLALFLYGGVHLAVASLAMQLFIGVAQSLAEYRRGNYLEAGGHFLMGMVRSSQLYGQVQLLQVNWALKGNIMHTIAYYLQKPLQLTSEYVLRAFYTPIRAENSTIEKANRCASVCLSALFAPVAISLYALGEGVHYCGNTINGTSYTYWRGNGAEKPDDQNIKCMTLNACMFWGGLPLLFGGVRPAGERIEALAQLIQEQDPDILFLQETSFPASCELFEKLKDQYAHCFTRIGPNPFGMGAELVVFSKVPMQNVEFYQYPYEKGMLRGAFFFETPSYTFVNTHLAADENSEERRRQFDLLTQRIEEKKKESDRNFFILGDLNIDSYASDEEYQNTIGKHPYFDPRKELHQGTESTTNAMTNQVRGKEVYSNLSEMIDYALLYGSPGEFELRSDFVKTYSIEKPEEALSDHQGLILEISKR